MAEQRKTPRSVEPVPSRPQIEGYGVPESTDGMMAWGDVVARLESAKNYWVATASPKGRPHAVPVWAIWFDGTLYISMGSSARTARNIAANPVASVHLESGDQVVILEGNVEVVHDPDPALSTALDDAFAAKYDYRPSVADSNVTVGEGFFALQPRLAVSWTSFPGDMTRWTFAENSD